MALSSARPATLVLSVLTVAAAALMWLNQPAAPPQPMPVVRDVRQPRRPVKEAAAPDERPRMVPLEAYSAPTEDERAAAPSIEATPSIEDVVSRVTPAVVLVEAGGGRGSGFFVSPDTLITNVHVVNGASSVTIRNGNGTSMPARVDATSRQFDLAVLKVPGAPAPATIPLGSAKNIRVGQEVIAIGSPLGTLQNTVTRGIVSAVRRSGNATLVQTDAAVNPGNSGGPLLDRTGAVIGITTMGYADRQGLNFAVAVDHAAALLQGRPEPMPLPSIPSSTHPAPPSPAMPTEAEQQRSNGTAALERTLAQAAARADALDDYWRQFRSRCYEGEIAGGFGREWFALFEPRAMRGLVAPGCEDALETARRHAAQIAEAVAAAEEAARRDGVYPGVRRDARRKYRLDYAGWDR
jgi:S1-C subfamily serine protease